MKWRWAYPANWDKLARACKERAGWCCETCGIIQGAPVVARRTGVVYHVALAAAHLDHDPWNPRPRLRALCPSCHARYDYSHREQERWLALERKRHQWLVRHWKARQCH